MIKNKMFTVNSTNIIHETIDDEVVIVDLEKGFYYSLRHTAAQIWQNIITGFSEADIISNLSKQYDIDQAQIEDPIKKLIHQLEVENIIVRIPSDSISDKPDKIEFNSIKATGEKFSNPVIEKFTDMSELLLLDPIHEVDETGWPNMAPNQPSIEEDEA
jgi:hypothetical protein